MNVSTSNAFSDGLTLQDGTFLPLNQVRLPVKPQRLARISG